MESCKTIPHFTRLRLSSGMPVISFLTLTLFTLTQKSTAAGFPKNDTEDLNTNMTSGSSLKLQEQAEEDTMEKVDLIKKTNSTGEAVNKIEGENMAHCLVTGLGNTYITTFNDSQFEFRGHCMYMLLSDLKDASPFSIMLDQQEDCLKGRCTRKIIINKGNLPSLELINMTMFIQQHGQSFPISYSGMYIYGTQEELYIKINKRLSVLWNGRGTIIVSMKKQSYIAGLCSYSNDVVGHTVAAMWELKNVARVCTTQRAEDYQLCQAAANCLDKGIHQKCSLRIRSILERACKNDVCWGNEICPSRLILLKQCSNGAVEDSQMKEINSCVPECRPTYYFSNNASICPNTCQNYWNNVQCNGPGLMGCICPEGYVSYHGTCILPRNCPCQYNGQVFQSGTNIQLFCLKCTCHGGQMDCSDLECPVLCSVTGSQYITTFDGTRYYFYGGCVHILVKTNAFVVYIGTNTCQMDDSGICIEYVILTIKELGMSVKLTKTGRVYLGQNEIGLPYVYETVPFLTIRQASSMFIEILSGAGVHVQYDFQGGRVYVIIQPALIGETLGLCGTFNPNHPNDFMSSSYLIDFVPKAFVNSWKASPQCVDIPTLPVFEPCKANPEKESYAKEKCSIIKGHVFKSCHFINPERFYDQCKQDVCHCSDMKSCLCSSLANYAHVCLLYGVYIDFRAMVHDCAVNCSGHMVYNLANYTCEGNCYHLSTKRSCHFLPSSGYIEGCRCPDNMFYNPHAQGCAPSIMDCPCFINGLMYQPGDKTPSPTPMRYQDCVCKEAEVQCTQVLIYRKEQCTKDEVYVNCTNTEAGKRCEPSCENQGNKHFDCSFSCEEGCTCKPNFVRGPDGTCISRTECPCKHGGLLYFPGEIFLRDCNVCTCQAGLVNCTEEDCSRACVAYGESQYVLFDKLWLEYESNNCRILLAESMPNSTGLPFKVEVKNAECRKEVYITVGTVTLKLDSRDGMVPYAEGPNSPFQIFRLGLFMVVETAAGLTVYWDLQMHVLVQIKPELSRFVRGFCGEGDESVSVHLNNIKKLGSDYGNQWVTPMCRPQLMNIPPAEYIRYAQSRCNQLMSDQFASCHQEIHVDQYFKSCKSVTAKCYDGKSDKCFCGAASAYSLACCQQGIIIDWRKPDNCPPQCESYNRGRGNGPFFLVNKNGLPISIEHSTKHLSVGEDYTSGELWTSFMITPALYKGIAIKDPETSPNYLSLESVKYPNYFVRYYDNGTVSLEPWQMVELFLKQASFVVHKNRWFAGYNAFESYILPNQHLTATVGEPLSMKGYSAGKEESMSFMLRESGSAKLNYIPCEWRYHPCDKPCTKTCQDPHGTKCRHTLKIDGCFPYCPEKRLLDETTYRCVHQADCKSLATSVAKDPGIVENDPLSSKEPAVDAVKMSSPQPLQSNVTENIAGLPAITATNTMKSVPKLTTLPSVGSAAAKGGLTNTTADADQGSPDLTPPETGGDQTRNAMSPPATSLNSGSAPETGGDQTSGAVSPPATSLSSGSAPETGDDQTRNAMSPPATSLNSGSAPETGGDQTRNAMSPPATSLSSGSAPETAEPVRNGTSAALSATEAGQVRVAASKAGETSGSTTRLQTNAPRVDVGGPHASAPTPGTGVARTPDTGGPHASAPTPGTGVARTPDTGGPHASAPTPGTGDARTPDAGNGSSTATNPERKGATLPQANVTLPQASLTHTQTGSETANANTPPATTASLQRRSVNPLQTAAGSSNAGWGANAGAVRRGRGSGSKAVAVNAIVPARTAFGSFPHLMGNGSITATAPTQGGESDATQRTNQHLAQSEGGGTNADPETRSGAYPNSTSPATQTTGTPVGAAPETRSGAWPNSTSPATQTTGTPVSAAPETRSGAWPNSTSLGNRSLAVTGANAQPMGTPVSTAPETRSRAWPNSTSLGTNSSLAATGANAQPTDSAVVSDSRSARHHAPTATSIPETGGTGVEPAPPNQRDPRSSNTPASDSTPFTVWAAERVHTNMTFLEAQQAMLGRKTTAETMAIASNELRPPSLITDLTPKESRETVLIKITPRSLRTATKRGRKAAAAAPSSKTAHASASSREKSGARITVPNISGAHTRATKTPNATFTRATPETSVAGTNATAPENNVPRPDAMNASESSVAHANTTAPDRNTTVPNTLAIDTKVTLNKTLGTEANTAASKSRDINPQVNTDSESTIQGTDSINTNTTDIGLVKAGGIGIDPATLGCDAGANQTINGNSTASNPSVAHAQARGCAGNVTATEAVSGNISVTGSNVSVSDINIVLTNPIAAEDTDAQKNATSPENGLGHTNAKLPEIGDYAHSTAPSIGIMHTNATSSNITNSLPLNVTAAHINATTPTIGIMHTSATSSSITNSLPLNVTAAHINATAPTIGIMHTSATSSSITNSLPLNVTAAHIHSTAPESGVTHTNAVNGSIVTTGTNITSTDPNSPQIHSTYSKTEIPESGANHTEIATIESNVTHANENTSYTRVASTNSPAPEINATQTHGAALGSSIAHNPVANQTFTSINATASETRVPNTVALPVEPSMMHTNGTDAVLIHSIPTPPDTRFNHTNANVLESNISHTIANTNEATVTKTNTTTHDSNTTHSNTMASVTDTTQSNTTASNTDTTHSNITAPDTTSTHSNTTPYATTTHSNTTPDTDTTHSNTTPDTTTTHSNTTPDTTTTHSNTSASNTATTHSNTTPDTTTTTHSNTTPDTDTTHSNTTPDTATTHSNRTAPDTTTTHSNTTPDTTTTTHSNTTPDTTTTTTHSNTTPDTTTSTHSNTTPDTASTHSNTTTPDTNTTHSNTTPYTNTTHSNRTAPDTDTTHSNTSASNADTTHSNTTPATETNQSNTTATDSEITHSKTTTLDSETTQSNITAPDTETTHSKTTALDTETTQSNTTAPDTNTTHSNTSPDTVTTHSNATPDTDTTSNRTAPDTDATHSNTSASNTDTIHSNTIAPDTNTTYSNTIAPDTNTTHSNTSAYNTDTIHSNTTPHTDTTHSNRTAPDTDTTHSNTSASNTDTTHSNTPDTDTTHNNTTPDTDTTHSNTTASDTDTTYSNITAPDTDTTRTNITALENHFIQTNVTDPTATVTQTNGTADDLIVSATPRVNSTAHVNGTSTEVGDHHNRSATGELSSVHTNATAFVSSDYQVNAMALEINATQNNAQDTNVTHTNSSDPDISIRHSNISSIESQSQKHAAKSETNANAESYQPQSNTLAFNNSTTSANASSPNIIAAHTNATNVQTITRNTATPDTSASYSNASATETNVSHDYAPDKGLTHINISSLEMGSPQTNASAFNSIVIDAAVIKTSNVTSELNVRHMDASSPEALSPYRNGTAPKASIKYSNVAVLETSITYPNETSSEMSISHANVTGPKNSIACTGGEMSVTHINATFPDANVTHTNATSSGSCIVRSSAADPKTAFAQTLVIARETGLNHSNTTAAETKNAFVNMPGPDTKDIEVPREKVDINDKLAAVDPLKVSANETASVPLVRTNNASSPETMDEELSTTDERTAYMDINAKVRENFSIQNNAVDVEVRDPASYMKFHDTQSNHRNASIRLIMNNIISFIGPNSTPNESPLDLQDTSSVKAGHETAAVQTDASSPDTEESSTKPTAPEPSRSNISIAAEAANAALAHATGNTTKGEMAKSSRAMRAIAAEVIPLATSETKTNSMSPKAANISTNSAASNEANETSPESLDDAIDCIPFDMSDPPSNSSVVLPVGNNTAETTDPSVSANNASTVDILSGIIDGASSQMKDLSVNATSVETISNYNGSSMSETIGFEASKNMSANMTGPGSVGTNTNVTAVESMAMNCNQTTAGPAGISNDTMIPGNPCTQTKTPMTETINSVTGANSSITMDVNPAETNANSTATGTNSTTPGIMDISTNTTATGPLDIKATASSPGTSDISTAATEPVDVQTSSTAAGTSDISTNNTTNPMDIKTNSTTPRTSDISTNNTTNPMDIKTNSTTPRTSDISTTRTGTGIETNSTTHRPGGISTNTTTPGTLRCEERECPPPPTCDKHGEAPIANASDTCCNVTVCGPVCSFNNTYMLPGQTVHHQDGQNCITITCTNELSRGGFLTLNVSAYICGTACKQGFELRRSKDTNACCPECAQVSCVYTSSLSAEEIVIKLHEKHTLNKCTHIICKEFDGHFVTEVQSTFCPALDEAVCRVSGGEVVDDASGCCRYCIYKQMISQCGTMMKNIKLTDGSCSAEVAIAVCEGQCSSITCYEPSQDRMVTECSCCLPNMVKSTPVILTCTNGKTRRHIIAEPVSCRCRMSYCTDMELEE